MLKPETRLEWAFVGITAAQAIIIISLQTFGFQAVLSVDSCRIKNKVQLWTQGILNICFSIATGMEYFQVNDATERSLYVCIGLLPSHGVLLVFVRAHQPGFADDSKTCQVPGIHARHGGGDTAIVYLVTRLIVLTGDGLLASTLMKEEMLLFATFALVFTMISIVFAVLCVFNFGKGLKPLLQGQGTNNIPTSTSALELNPRHLSIRTMDSERMSKRFDID
uniref:Uncharacterized protein n=1 Tax=Fusarium oxysporum (strain Fo5176) TaxID=660025 RepID=A0A0D2YFY6_FUSOF